VFKLLPCLWLSLRMQKRFLYYLYWELFLHYSGKSSHKCKLWVFGLPSFISCAGLCQRHYGAGLYRWDTSVIICLLCCFHLDLVWEREREFYYSYRHSFCYNIYACGKIIKLLHSTIAVCVVCTLCMQICNINFYLNVSKSLYAHLSCHSKHVFFSFVELKYIFHKCQSTFCRIDIYAHTGHNFRNDLG